MKIRLLSLITLAVTLAVASCVPAAQVTDVRCELLESPLAIDNTQPHFSWKVKSSAQGAEQVAYQILVASSSGKLTEQDADLWNSGKVMSGENVGIVYAGSQLSSRSMAYWKVRVWLNGEDGDLDWSESQRFGVGLLAEGDWAEDACFVGTGHTEGKSQPAPLLRSKFEYNGHGEDVILYVNSLGYHEAYVNGKPVTESVLNPAVSQLTKRSLIVAYDVTSLVKDGENDLVIWAGRGWYQPHNAEIVDGGPYVRAQVDVLSPQGARTLVATNHHWQWAESGRSTFGLWRAHDMGGEIVDARTTPADMEASTLDALQWRPVEVAEIVNHKASPQMCEQNVKIDPRHPVKVWQQGDSSFVYDMGSGFVGFTEVVMPAVASGEQVELHYDDCQIADTTQFRDGLYTDFFIGNGAEGGKFESKFNYKGYRYLKIKGLTEALPLEAITGYRVRTGYGSNAKFECSDADMNAIHNMMHSTLEALSLGGYIVDCPQIERLGYGGDGNASTPTAQTMFNLAPLYMNWLQAWADSQRENGDMPHTAPNPYMAGGGPFWCGFIINASWQTYLNYGDMRLMERYYPNMLKWLGYAESNMPEGLLQEWEEVDYRWWYLGDWATPAGIDQTNKLSVDLVNNCFLSDCYAVMGKIAKAMGKDEDVAMFAKKKEALNALIHTTFFDSVANSYSTGTQIDLTYPMLVDATPAESVEAVKATLRNETAGRFNGHLATGLVGVPVVTQWVMKNGESQFMYDMLKKREMPGFLYMIDNGATLTWEHWNGVRSQIHNCYNGLGVWFYQALAGIMPDDEHPGYKVINIAPQMVDGITWVKAEKDTPQGLVKVSWAIVDGVFGIDVEVPVGSTANVMLPSGGDAVKLTSGKHHLECKM